MSNPPEPPAGVPHPFPEVISVPSGSALFPVVGVGASSGGLAATAELLHLLGARPGLAVVVVHHLDPNHDSGLVDILARSTELTVRLACEGERIAPDFVYVVPPNAGIELARGTLRVTPRVGTGRLHLPIDTMFASLADDQAANAVGVLLSGAGADGAQGVMAIRRAGGTTFAQDATAEFRGMPEAAIATGCVDHVLSLPALARALCQLGLHPREVGRFRSRAVLDADTEPILDAAHTGAQPGTRPPHLPAAPDQESAFSRVLASVRSATGVDFLGYKRHMVRRRVQRRVQFHGLASLEDYAALLAEKPLEATALCEEMLIQVTGFFRDPQMFEALESLVYPKLLPAGSPRPAIRVWVPGCSSGEEVYSLAISLLEYLAAHDANDTALTLFGTDVSEHAIEKARAGRFDASMESHVSQPRIERYFEKLDTGYQVRKELRERCVFAKHNATHDPPFSGMDLISCRNLMIYLEAPLQERLIPIFHYALHDLGFLVLGTSETTRQFPGFTCIDSANKVYARTLAAPRMLFDFSEPRPPPSNAPGALPAPKPWASMDVQREADRLVLEMFAPPAVVITDDLAIMQFRGSMGPYLAPAPGVASFDLLRMVRGELRAPLRALVDDARMGRVPARRSGLVLESGLGGGRRTLELEVVPFGVALTAERFYIVLFKEEGPTLSGPVGAPPRAAAPELSGPHEPGVAPYSQLAQELAATRAYLQSVIEQFGTRNADLRAANEEVIASNEELRSTNEELQMAKEELLGSNEQLRTLNEEMNVRNAEAKRLNDDLANTLSSIEIPIVIIGRDLRIRRFTLAAGRFLGLTGADLGRSLTDIRARVQLPDLVQVVTDVLEQLAPLNRPVRDAAGRLYQLVVRPYVTAEKQLDGAVVTVFDVDDTARKQTLLAQAYADTIVDTVAEHLALLDQDLRVLSANQTFRQSFQPSGVPIEGLYFYELDAGSLDRPGLRAQLRELQVGARLEGVLIEPLAERACGHSYLLKARRIEQRNTILVALQDLTGTRRAVLQAELGFREMLINAPEAILMTEAHGDIVFANRLAAQIFGFEETELIGKNVDSLVPERLRSEHRAQRAHFFDAPTARRMGSSGQPICGLRKDGSEFPAEVVISSTRGGGKLLAVSFISDVTAQRVTAQNIRTYQTRLQRMAFDATVSEDRERRRIAADLHDGIGQALALAQFKLSAARKDLAQPERAKLDEVIGLLEQSVADTRTLTFELSPPLLYELGLKDALSWLVEDLERRHQLRVQLESEHDDPASDLEVSTAAVLYRAVRELLLNVFKHAQTPTASVSLRRRQSMLEVEVVDTGRGFAAAEQPLHGAAGGFGLFSVREQIERVGGCVEVHSAPGLGTRVKIAVPIAPGQVAAGEVL